MYEVELKVQVSHESVRERLASIDADHVETVTQEDTYYDAPDRSFAETDEALRIRSVSREDDSTTVLTYKGPLVDANSKTRTEAETTVADNEAMAAILTGLGYEPAATVRKTREYYTVDECTVTLDSVDDVGEFVEVEYSSDVKTESGIDAAREQAEGVLDQLGLSSDDQIRTSYLELLLEKQ